jgi:hypothetical protein
MTGRLEGDYDSSEAYSVIPGNPCSSQHFDRLL